MFGRNENAKGVAELKAQYKANQRRMLTEKLSEEMFNALQDENADLMRAMNKLMKNK